MPRKKGSKNIIPSVHDMQYLTAYQLDKAVQVILDLSNYHYSHIDRDTKEEITNVLDAYMKLIEMRANIKTYNEYSSQKGKEILDFIETLQDR